MHLSLLQPSELPNAQSQHWRDTLPDTSTENKHSGNEWVLVTSTSEASPSSAALAPEVKVSQLLSATQRDTGPARRCSQEAQTRSKWKSSGKTAIVLCLTKAKLGKSYHFYSGKNNHPSTQALGFYHQRERMLALLKGCGRAPCYSPWHTVQLYRGPDVSNSSVYTSRGYSLLL